MFQTYYNFREQPFGVTPDPRFLYLGRSHREALASLHYGIESDRGFVALIAHPGLGKTTLSFQLLEKLQQASRTVFLFQTQSTAKELFQCLLNGLGVDPEGMGLISMHYRLNAILCREMLAGRRFILAIDEAHNLGAEALESIRLLSNFETSRDKMLQILLIGQSQLAQKLAKPELEQLQQRISVFARLEPLSPEETSRYIAHRMRVAGYEGPSLFSPEALQLIADHSQGIPRKINTLCFSSLSLGLAMDRKRVDAAMVREVIADREGRPLKVGPLVVSPATSAKPASTRLVTAKPALRPYPVKSKARSGKWMSGAAAIAACAAIGVGGLTFHPAIMERFAQMSGLTPSQNSAEPLRIQPTADDETTGLSNFGENIEAPKLAVTEIDHRAASSGDPNSKTITVQSGDTIFKIIRRTAGEDTNSAIQQIRKLNPDVANFDHIEPGQTIRMPRVPGASELASADAVVAPAGN